MCSVVKPGTAEVDVDTVPSVEGIAAVLTLSAWGPTLDVKIRRL